MQIFDDGVNELRLSQPFGSIILLLDLNSQKVTNVALIIDGEVLGAGTQVGDYPIDGPIISGKYNAVVNIHQEYHRPAIIEAWVKFAWCEADFMHAPVHVFVPDPASLFLTINIAYQLESVGLSCHSVLLVTLG